MKNVLKQVWFWVIIVALVIAGGILFYANQEEVALTVNGEEFSQAKFDQIVDQIKSQYKMYGMEMKKSDIKDRAVEQAVQQVLLMDLAKNKGIEVTDKEIKNKKEELMKQYGAKTEEEFLKLLKNKGVTSKKRMEELLAQEIKISKLMDLYSKKVEITEKDLKSAYEDYKSQIESTNKQSESKSKEILSFEKIKKDLRSNLIQQKVTPLILKDVKKLKEKAEIKEYVTTEDITIENSNSKSQQTSDQKSTKSKDDSSTSKDQETESTTKSEN